MYTWKDYLWVRFMRIGCSRFGCGELSDIFYTEQFMLRSLYL